MVLMIKEVMATFSNISRKHNFAVDVKRHQSQLSFELFHNFFHYNMPLHLTVDVYLWENVILHIIFLRLKLLKFSDIHKYFLVLYVIIFLCVKIKIMNLYNMITTQRETILTCLQLRISNFSI